MRAYTSMPKNPIIGDIYYDVTLGLMVVWNGRNWHAISEVGQMKYVLMLDDERNFDDINYRSFCNTIFKTRVTTVELAKAEVLQYGLPQVIFFDHDLGEGQPDATKFMWWLLNEHLDGALNLQELNCVVVHSANPVGAERLIKLWEGFNNSEGIMVPVHRIWPGEVT